MADPNVTYPFDPTGQASTNRVVNEEIVILPPGDRLFHYAMPVNAPFFEKGLVVQIRDLTNNLIPLYPGIDYYLSHKFMDASLATMHEIYGSISFLRRDIVGTLLVTYQHLGGIWTIDSATMSEILLNKIRNPRITSWEQVVERPVDFPVIDHPWNFDDMVGQKEILELIDKFYITYLASLDPAGGGGGTGIITEHIRNKNNPHEVTAAQVGAYTKAEVTGLLLNYLTITGTAANASKLENKTLDEISTQILATKIAAALRADSAAVSDRTLLADDSTLFSGITYTELMQRIRVSAVSSADRLNGLLPAEVAVEILKGKAADSGKLDGKTLAVIKAELQAASSDALTLQGKSLAQLMADVKATKVDSAATADDATRFGGKTYTEAMTDIRSGQSADSAKLAGKTLAEIKAELQAASSDAQSLQGKSLSQIMADVKATKVDRSTTSDNTDKFGNLTYEEARTAILSGQAADSAKLGGKTYAEVLAAIQNGGVDAISLQGKTLLALMADVKATMVNNALSAEDAKLLGGASLESIMQAVNSLKPAMSSDSEKVYGFLFTDLVTNILSSIAYRNGLPYRASYYQLTGSPVTSPNNGGTQDPNYTYLRIGLIFLDGTERTGSSMGLSFFFDKEIHDIDVTFGYSKTANEVKLDVFSRKDLGNRFYLGSRIGTNYGSDGGSALYAELYVKFLKVGAPKSYGAFQKFRNNFDVQLGAPVLFDNTYDALNVIAWRQSTPSSDLILATQQTQDAFDDLADGIDALIQQPAA